MSDLKPIAIKPLLADLGLNIYEVNYGIDDEVVYGYSNDDNTMTATIEFETESGRPYFLDNNNEKQYLDDFVRVNESKSVDTLNCSKKSCVYEALTDADIDSLSQLNLTEDELSIVLNMFELVGDEHKDDMMSLVNLLFENKKLTPLEPTEISASEKYTRMLLSGGNR